MRVELLALYGGPDQVMTVTSGLASLLGLLLIFWNKVVAISFRISEFFVPPNPLTSKSRRMLPRKLRSPGLSCQKK